MYDDIVKQLRDAAKMSDALAVLLPHSEGNATAKLYKEAADAIEELSKQLDDMNEANIALYGALPKWIPVTERMPKTMHEYVLCCGEKGGQFVGWVFVDMIENGKARAFQNGGRGRYITHWMPLPSTEGLNET